MPDDTDYSRKMKYGERNIRNRQHKRASFKATLCPDVSVGKRATPVAFDITCSVFKNILPTVDPNLSVNLVLHTADAVTALHERNNGERSHYVIAYGRTRTESKRAFKPRFLIVQIQGYPFFGKNAIIQRNT